MLKRTITAIVAMAAFIPILYFSDTLVFPAAMALLSLVAVYEMTSCVGLKKNLWIAIPSYLTGLLLPLIPAIADEAAVPLAGAVCILYMIIIFAATVFSRGKTDYTVAASAFTGVFYIAVSFTCIVLLRGAGKYLYLLVFIGPWVSDTFAYIFGRMLGKHKLIPEVSPKKTVEGSVAGIIFAAAAFVIYAVIISKFFDTSANPHYAVMAFAGAAVSVISQIGDLSASVIKRRFGVKDYGWILPGHGGIMDRFDSVILTAPALYIISQIPALSGLLI